MLMCEEAFLICLLTKLISENSQLDDPLLLNLYAKEVWLQMIEQLLS